MLVNCITLAVQVEPAFDEESQLGQVLYVADWVFISLFILELLLQGIAFNFAFGEGALLRCT